MVREEDTGGEAGREREERDEEEHLRMMESHPSLVKRRRRRALSHAARALAHLHSVESRAARPATAKSVSKGGMTLPLSLAAIVCAAIIAWLAARARRVSILESELAIARAELSKGIAARAELTATIESERKAGRERLELVQQQREELKNAFASLSSEALQRNNTSFLQLASTTLGGFQQKAESDFDARRKAIDSLVTPLGQTLVKMDGVLQQVQLDRVKSDSAIEEQFKALRDGNAQLRLETASLVTALRTPHTRGRWGEIQLRRVVEMAGMLPYCDFEEQPQTDEPTRLRPDLRVNLPGRKLIVVDAKVPIEGYLAATETTDDAIRRIKLADHARQVRDHINKLSSKSYWEQFHATPEFVVMFLPGESFFSAALQADPNLIEHGVEQRVIPASPTTLIALLRAAHYGWSQQQIAENAQKISRLGKELYERLNVLVEHVGDVGSALGKAVASYNKSVGSIEGRLLVSARKLKELTVTDKELPELEPLEIAVRDFESPQLTD